MQSAADGPRCARPPVAATSARECGGAACHLLAGIFAAVLLTWSAASLATHAAGAPQSPHILVLYSYGDGGTGIEVFRDEFRSFVNAAGVKASDVFIEHLDLERTKDTPAYRSQLRDLLLNKYAARDIGVVVTVQQPAQDFLLQEGRAIAPAAPALTLQAPVPTPAQARGRRIVSLLAHFDIQGTLERALELFPATEHVFIVAGSSDADRKVAAEALAIGTQLPGKLAFETTVDLSLEQMLERTAKLPRHSVILFTQYNRDNSGHVTLAYEIEAMLTKTANAPVFGLYDFNLDDGGIGGSVVSVKALGKNAAQLAVEISRGKLPPSAPVTSIPMPATPLFDWAQVQRWGGDTRRLPSDSVFVNRRPTVWEEHRGAIIGSATVFALQLLLITNLMISRRRRMAVERQLRDSEDRCRIKLNAALEDKRQYEAGLELLLALNQRASRLTEQQICSEALDIAVKTTKSRIGYLHLVNDDQNTIALVTWNAQARESCSATSESHYPLASAGIWADSARQRQPVIHNDYQHMDGKKSCPAGHTHLVRHMSVPVVDGDKVRMILGVGNKDSDYGDADAQQLLVVANEVQKIVMKRRAEEALHESESRFRFITDLSPALVWIADTDRRCTWFNKTWLAFTGRSLEQAMGNGWTEGVHPDDAERCLATYVKHFNARQPFSMEYRLRRHDGEYRWVIDAGQPRFDEGGVFLGYVGSCLDINAQREVENQLRKLWLAVEQSPDSIVITDLEGNIEYVNRAFEAVSGYGATEVLGQNPRLLQSGQTPAATYDAMWATLRAGNPWEGEFVNRRKSGDTYTEFERISPVRQPDGRITHYLAIKKDITAAKHAEDAIRESKVLLQCVIDSTPDWIHVKDREHRFMLVNQSFARAFGKTPEAMINGYDTDFLPREMCDGNADKGIRSLHGDDDAIFAGESIHDPCDKISFADGSVRVFDTYKGPLRGPSQEVYGVLTYRRDITARYHTEQEQRTLETQLRQAQKMELIGHLTGGIAHDFNNILAAMFGYAELAQMSLTAKPDPQLSSYLKEILQAGIRAKELVSQLLTFSHRRETANEAIAVAPIIKEVAKLLRSTMPVTISIDISLAPGLPEALISSVHLHQILMNLGVNARDAIGSKGAVAIKAERVQFKTAHACASCHLNFFGDYLALTVSDTGEGIPAANLTKIFDPFFTTKDVGRGSGLGLSVLHGIVHSANGHIEVRSTPGAGTEFCIYLPAQVRDAERLEHDVALNRENATAHGHVLVVDDEASIVGFMTTLLEDIGCKVTGLSSATEALRLFQSAPDDIDMVITDQTMPDLTGAELATAMLACRPDLPVVLATGYSNVIDENLARRIGIRRFLMKPVPATILCDIVAECLAAKAKRAP